jgi:saposin
MKVVVVLLALIALAYAQTPYCSQCQSVVALIESFVTDNSSEEFVLGHVGQLCILFPSPYSDDCKQAIKENGPAIFELIVNQEPPAKVCAQLSLCGQKKVVPKVSRVSSKDPTTCFLCTQIISLGEQYVSDNSTEQEVEDALNNYVCPLMGPFSDQCLQLVSDYPQLIQYLINSEPPNVACGQLELCPVPKPVVVAVEAKDPISCSLCVYIVTYLEDAIADNATEAQLTQIILTEICPSLPSDYQQQCQTFAKELPNYIDELEKDVPPQQACSNAGVCPAPIRVTPRLGVRH